ncbi:hypothetical protein NQ317_002228 [Molorchus minor]|uniref:RanBD1 domain-containing protein n=1 Tax=Molorchus minor TaxID=1323400 RepID=A0ABQ9JF18_9CUCU|nr:hypothetical protein NQ317_002228 [Molorchus minor]
MLRRTCFSSAIKHEVKADMSQQESTRNLEQANEKYEEVEVITGEEHENNILKFLERGRGILRLNDFHVDDDHIGSRLVFRTAGSLRVILNTKISGQKMTIDKKASDKSIRLTALDANGEIKVFLIMNHRNYTGTCQNLFGTGNSCTKTKKTPLGIRFRGEYQ